MSERKPIEQIISAWKADWGNEFPKSKEDKLMQFNAFFETAKSYGYTSPEDYPLSTLNKILYATVNDNYRNKQNLKIWKTINQDLLEQSYVIFFGLVAMKKGTYIEKHTISAGGIQYEPATDLVERPMLDASKLGPAPEKSTTTMSDGDFLEELERSTDEWSKRRLQREYG